MEDRQWFSNWFWWPIIVIGAIVRAVTWPLRAFRRRSNRSNDSNGG